MRFAYGFCFLPQVYKEGELNTSGTLDKANVQGKQTDIDIDIYAVGLKCGGSKSEGRWFDPSWCHWNFSLT